MNQLFFTTVVAFVVLATAGTGYLMFLSNQNETLRREIQVVEDERDAAQRAIKVLESERIAADARNRAVTAGKEAINAIAEGKDMPASETLLKSLQIANEIGGLK